MQIDSVIMVRSEVGGYTGIFKHLLCASVYPQILVLELQAPVHGHLLGAIQYILCVYSSCYRSHNL